MLSRLGAPTHSSRRLAALLLAGCLGSSVLVHTGAAQAAGPTQPAPYPSPAPQFGPSVEIGAAPVAPVAASESSASLQRQSDALNARIAKVSDELAAGAAAYEKAQAQFQALTQGQFEARSEVDLLDVQSAAARGSINELARAAYKGGVPPVVSALLTGNPGSVGQLAYVQRSVNRIGMERRADSDQLLTESVQAQQSLVQSDGNRRDTLALRQDLDRQLAALTDKADRLTADLAVNAQQLEQARQREALEALAHAQAAERQRLLAVQREADQRAAAAAAAAQIPYLPGVTGTGGCQMPSGLEANGFLSGASLCPLEIGGGHRLRTDAAKAFDLMNRAHLASVGTPLCVTDSYRSYPEQVDVFKRKPGLAATPGRSQHGWGLAVDFCGGVQTFGSAEHAWMQINAYRFGWVHPAWAQQGGSKPEAWHWEFQGSLHS